MSDALKKFLNFNLRPAIEIHADKSPPPKLFATTAKPVTLQYWQGHGKDPEFIDKELPVGTSVRVVMASRFGDVGITDDLTAEHGYAARVDPERGILTGWRERP